MKQEMNSGALRRASKGENISRARVAVGSDTWRKNADWRNAAFVRGIRGIGRSPETNMKKLETDHPRKYHGETVKKHGGEDSKLINSKAREGKRRFEKEDIQKRGPWNHPTRHGCIKGVTYQPQTHRGQLLT